MAGLETDQQLTWLSDQSQEDALHASRLLSVEERPFQRVSKSLLSKDSLLRRSTTHLPSPPPDGEAEAETLDYASQLQRFREDVLLDFAALESSIVRIQLVRSSNERERERYAVEKAKILNAADAVRNNTLELRSQLAEAQRVLELRKGYDVLASKILDDRALKSREECSSEIEKLEKEIEDLEQENIDFEYTWQSRREQFEKVALEGEAMLRLIKDIKDEPEVEKEETVDGDDAGNQEDGRSPRPLDTGNATPMADSREAEGNETPAEAHNAQPNDEPAHVQASGTQDDVDMSGIGENATDAPHTTENAGNRPAPSNVAEDHHDNMDET